MKDKVKAVALKSLTTANPNGQAAVCNNLPPFVTSATEVAAKEFPDDRFLWGSQFVRSALNGIVGGSDTGKSTLLRLLAIAIAKGEEEFLGLPLRTKTKKVLIFSLEDGERDVNSFFKDFKSDLIGTMALDNIHFVFEYDKSVLHTLENIVNSEHYDAIFIDSYSDAFTGFNGNDQMDTKRFLNPFDLIAKKQNAAIVFLHHINKAAKEGSINKGSTMGSAAFEQDVRSLVSITKPKGYHSNLRYIEIKKGNYVSSDEKLKVLTVRFNESKLDFEYQSYTAQKQSIKKGNFSEEFKAEVIAFYSKCKEVKPSLSWRDFEKAVKGKFKQVVSHTTLKSWIEKTSN